MAQEYTARAVEVLGDIMGNDKGPAAARVMAARELLDRGHSKSKEQVEVTQTNLGETYEARFLALGVAGLPALRALQAKMRAALVEAGIEPVLEVPKLEP